MVLANSTVPRLFAVIACSSLAHAATRELQSTDVTENVEVPYDRAYLGGDPLGQLFLQRPPCATQCFRPCARAGGHLDLHLRLCEFAREPAACRC